MHAQNGTCQRFSDIALLMKHHCASFASLYTPLNSSTELTNHPAPGRCGGVFGVPASQAHALCAAAGEEQWVRLT